MDQMNVKDFLRKYAIIDGERLDGSWVPLSVAMIAAEQVYNGKLSIDPSNVLSNEWYAIYKIDDECWYLAPKKHFDEHGHCSYEFEEPKIPHQFHYCMESCIKTCKNITVKEQKNILQNFGFIVDNIPKWWYER